MLQHERLDALCQLLQAMTRSTSGDTAYALSRFLRRIENVLLGGFLVTMIVLVVVAIWYRATLPKPIHGTPLPIDALFVVASAGRFFTWLWRASKSCKHYGGLVRRERAFSILSPLQQALRSDANFLAQLQTYDKETLDYGLLQYRHSVETFDGRGRTLLRRLRNVH